MDVHKDSASTGKGSEPQRSLAEPAPAVALGGWLGSADLLWAL